MKILFLTNLYPPHHAGTYDLRCQTVAEALRLRGHVVRVLTSNHGLTGEQRDAEIERRLILKGAYGHASVTAFRDVQKTEDHNHRALQETLASFQPEVVHVWSLRGLSKSFIYALRRSRLPAIYDIADLWLSTNLRDDPWLRWWNAPGVNIMRAALELSGQRSRLDAITPTRMMRGIDRIPEVYGPPDVLAQVSPNSIAAFRFDRIYFCSRALKEITEQAGYQVSHADVIYPGIPAQLFIGEIKPSSVPLKKLLVVCRLDEQSGVLTALQALQQLRRNKMPVALSIYGRGESDYISQVRSFVVQNALPVEFLTVSNQNRDLAAIYRQHDALLYPAEWEEPFVSTPLEAMACGLPVIGASIGGARELFRHGENSLIFTAGDATELASRIQELYLEPALRCQMAGAAQTEVQSRFNETVYIDQIESYLNASVEIWRQS